MKNIGTIAAAVVLAVVLAAYMCTFQVRFTEVAIKKTWGKPADKPIIEPGLYFQWPRPIQSVVIYDKRKRILENQTTETRTVDGKNLLLSTFTIWRIKDPSRFHTNFPDSEEDGAAALRDAISAQWGTVLGKHEFGEFISTGSNERRIREIEQELLRAIAQDMLEDYGIEVVDLGIKKLGLPESVTTAIFASMKAHEETKGQRYAAEGEAEAQAIVAGANALRERIMAAARQKVALIQRDAQVVVSGYYKEFAEHPEFRMFLDQVRTMREALRERTTLILSTKEAPWSVFDDDVRRQIWRDQPMRQRGPDLSDSRSPDADPDEKSD